jgi:uncharacterized protein YecA (UPF0149 family)
MSRPKMGRSSANRRAIKRFNAMEDSGSVLQRARRRPGILAHEKEVPTFAPAKVRRNDPCPCVSSKKFKWCCL